MINLSDKQELFKDYLVKKIGFLEDSFFIKYIQLLEMVSPKFRLLGKKNKIWDQELKGYTPENGQPFKRYEEKDNYFIPAKFNIIDYLYIELNVKKNKDYNFKDIQLNYISATDISNFTYCPVSFAISKTFELPKLESAIIGTLQHEKQTLINYLSPTKVKSSKDLIHQSETEITPTINSFLNDNNKLFFEEVANSVIIFHGHENKENKTSYFKSAKGNFVGQPDYIFRNNLTNDDFIVEEKFQFVPKDPSTFEYSSYSYKEEENIKKKRESKSFYDNHINQLSSYLYGISDYDLKFGYLVYWKYELENGSPNVVACNVYKTYKTEKGRLKIRETFIELKKLITSKNGKFDISKRVPAKCANCISNLLCGHKTGRYSSFSIPYSIDFLKTYFAEFPEELKKQVKKEISSSELASNETFITDEDVDEENNGTLHNI